MPECTKEKPCGYCATCVELAEAATEFVTVDPEAMKREVAAALAASKKRAAEREKK